MPAVTIDRKKVVWRLYDQQEYLVINRHVKQVIRLKGSGALIWQLLTEGNQIDEIGAFIHRTFGVDYEKAVGDTRRFIAQLHEKGLVEAEELPAPALRAYANLKFPAGFDQWVLTQRIPFSGLIELTRTCHLRCVHCFHPVHADDQRLSFEEWRRVLRELAAAGTFLLTFTGGELFLRSDAIDLIEAACDMGFIVTVLTTGTILTPTLMERLAKVDPDGVSLSLYGGTAESHEWMTRLPGSFETTLQQAKALRDMGLHVSLSFMITKQNRHELPLVQKLSAELGVPVQVDFKIFPRHNGDPEPLGLRLDESQVLELVQQRVVDYPEGQGHCMGGAGKYSITPEGAVKVCQVFPYPVGQLRQHSFAEIWNSPAMVELARRFQEEWPQECQSCEHRDQCYRCPAHSLLEEGNIAARQEYYCALTKMVKRLTLTEQLTG